MHLVTVEKFKAQVADFLKELEQVDKEDNL
jgi:hypothetical protein